MLYENQFLNFNGFHVSEFTKAFLSQKLNALLEEAPYGANLNATFARKEPHVFTGIIAIYSSAGRFYAKASGHKLKAVIHKLVEQIRKQLSKWKSRRFQHESIKNLPLKNDFDQSENIYETDSIA